MAGFDLSTLADLDLSEMEVQAIGLIFAKQKLNQSFWLETPQMFVENFVRCLRVAIPCNAVPSVVAAQGILESGWFSTDSLFGVKATKAQKAGGQGILEKTHEINAGKSQAEIDAFFETPSVQNNFANYFNYLSHRKPDSAQFMPDKAVGYLNYLMDPKMNGAYSTSPVYVQTVTTILKANVLQAFDHA